MASDLNDITDFEIVCRICLKKKPNLISIFKKILTPRLKEELNVYYNLQSYRELIEECASVQISENDSFPKNVCKICSKQLEQSYKLKVQCLSSEKMLKNLMGNCKTTTTVPNLFTESDDTVLSDTKNDLCENKIEIIVKQEVFEDFDTNDESKLDINYVEQVPKSVKDDGSNTVSEKYTFANEFIITMKEEPEEDLRLLKNELDNNVDNGTKYKCEDCFEEFITKIDATNHYKKLHLKIGNKCLFCNGVFLIDSDYRNHLVYPKHHCKLCSKEFGCTTSLTNHSKEHHNTCEKCDKTFRTLDVFNRHSCSKMSPLEKKVGFLCPYCGKTSFTEKRSFEQHLLRHRNDSSERIHQCKICDSKFITRHLLNRHLIKHTNERPYECDICKKKYKYSSALRKHKISHTNFRIPCNFCDKLWTSKDTLRKHQLVHTGERKFMCKYCNKPFGRQDNLQVHLRIHTGEKPFVCDKCGTGFSAKHVLRGHMKTHER